MKAHSPLEIRTLTIADESWSVALIVRVRGSTKAFEGLEFRHGDERRRLHLCLYDLPGRSDFEKMSDAELIAMLARAERVAD